MAEVPESADLALMVRYTGWDGLLGLAIDELAKVEGPLWAAVMC